MIASLEPYENFNGRIFIKDGEVVIYSSAFLGSPAAYVIGILLMINGYFSEISAFRLLIPIGIGLCVAAYRSREDRKQTAGIHEKDELIIFSKTRGHVFAQQNNEETLLGTLEANAFYLDKDESNLSRPFLLRCRLPNKNYGKIIVRYAKHDDAEAVLKKIVSTLS